MAKLKDLTLENLVERLGDLSHGSSKKIENWFDRAHFKLTKVGFVKAGYGLYKKDQFVATLKVSHGVRSSTGQIVFTIDPTFKLPETQSEVLPEHVVTQASENQ